MERVRCTEGLQQERCHFVHGAELPAGSASWPDSRLCRPPRRRLKSGRGRTPCVRIPGNPPAHPIDAGGALARMAPADHRPGPRMPPMRGPARSGRRTGRPIARRLSEALPNARRRIAAAQHPAFRKTFRKNMALCALSMPRGVGTQVADGVPSLSCTACREEGGTDGGAMRRDHRQRLEARRGVPMVMKRNTSNRRAGLGGMRPLVAGGPAQQRTARRTAHA
jgi:hypothetical protein